MKRQAWIAVAVVASAIVTSGAQAADTTASVVGGQRDLVWPRWQARLGLAASSDAESLRTTGDAGLVLGDYYFARLSGGTTSGGLRATSGLLWGASLAARTSALADSLMLRSGQGLNRQLLRYQRNTLARELAPASLFASPYLGLGWSSESLGGSWGWTADLGVAADRQNRLSGTTGSRSLDELVRELRFAPVMNLGLSYAF